MYVRFVSHPLQFPQSRVVGAAVQRVPVQRVVAANALPSWKNQQSVNNNDDCLV